MGLEEDLQKALKAQNQSDQNLEELRERVRQGETLGDPVKDAVFVWPCYSQLEKDFRELQKNVAENQDKQVLAIYSRHIKANDDGCVVELFDRTEINGLQLGVIRGELYFNFQQNDIIIPAAQYAHKGHVNLLAHERPITEDWTLIPGNLVIPKIEYIAKYLEGDYNLELLFGDEVELYFYNSMEFDIYKRSKARGEDAQACLERRFQTILNRGYVGDPEYVRALNVLNVKVPTSFKARWM